MKPELDYGLCMAAGQDAGNRNMRKDGHTQWNEDGWNIAAEVSNKLFSKIAGTGRKHVRDDCCSNNHIVFRPDVTVVTKRERMNIMTEQKNLPMRYGVTPLMPDQVDLLDCNGDELGIVNSVEIAEEIIRAVNDRDALIKALQDIVYSQDAGMGNRPKKLRIEIARDLLKQLDSLILLGNERKG